MFDLAKIPVMGKARYYAGDEPAAKERKVYLFWLLILLGRTWSFLPPNDKMWPSAEYLPTGTLASAAQLFSHHLTISCHGPFLLFRSVVADKQI